MPQVHLRITQECVGNPVMLCFLVFYRLHAIFLNFV